jgi:hypothetical protein
MTLFHIYCDLKDRKKAADFAEDVQAFLSYLHERELIEGYRITRRKFSFDPPKLGEFHIQIECKSADQLNLAMEYISNKKEDSEGFHQAVQAYTKSMTVSMYADFPEPVRKNRNTN